MLSYRTGYDDHNVTHYLMRILNSTVIPLLQSCIYFNFHFFLFIDPSFVIIHHVATEATPKGTAATPMPTCLPNAWAQSTLKITFDDYRIDSQCTNQQQHPLTFEPLGFYMANCGTLNQVQHQKQLHFTPY